MRKHTNTDRNNEQLSETCNCNMSSLERKCGMERPPEMMGMDVAWPYKRRQLGDTITYGCPNNKLTWVEEAAEQTVTCIWHRQTDSMMWWPQYLKDCNRKLKAVVTAIFHLEALWLRY